MKTAELERLQKLLANVGLGSRREIEIWIKLGRIKINEKIAQLGDKASLKDKILLDNKPIKIKNPSENKRRILIYHKPIGEICTRLDDQNRPTVFEHLPKLNAGRWIAVGRLDINTCGLLLFTNDGQWANLMMHPSSEIERTYAVRVLGKIDDAMLQRLKNGVKLEDGLARFAFIKRKKSDGANRWFEVTLKEGRKREVRRLWESQGCKTNRLIRIRFGQYQLPRDLKPGQWRDV